MDIIILDCGDAIKGESTTTNYKDKIECLSYSHGVAQQITGDQSNTKRTSGKPNHQDFTITKYMDLASRSLIDYCNQAKVIPTVKIIVGQNDAGSVVPFFEYQLTNALVSSVSVGGEGGGTPQETVTFNYTAISWAYMRQGAEVTAKWDLAANSAS